MDKEYLKKFYFQYRIVLFPVLTSLASLILIVLVIYPQISKLLSNNRAYSEILDKSKFLEVKALELETIDDEDLQRKVDLTLAALPTSQDYVEVINILQDLVSKYGFNLTSLDFGQSGDSSLSLGPVFSMKLEIIGPKNNLSSLLTEIESAYRPMRVSNFEISAARGRDEVTGLVSVNVYYAPLPKSVGEVDAILPKLSEKEQELINNLSQTVPAVSPSEPLGPRGKSDPFE